MDNHVYLHRCVVFEHTGSVRSLFAKTRHSDGLVLKYTKQQWN
ncbi:hypothetical protein JCM19239_3719 [Vibrio variabilis]|uniref:Uncharacterized protein n=1 Tax=Vibrio variabilis TaxID=990271 RepID=A0ABQ0JB41_9VIBR|nr:hypothetical protein JCM19239_3719 [Vibrio variabilis]